MSLMPRGRGCRDRSGHWCAPAPRSAGGHKTNMLADFFIGAHAAVLSCAILTRDGRRYRNYFPRVALITPDESETP